MYRYQPWMARWIRETYQSSDRVSQALSPHETDRLANNVAGAIDNSADCNLVATLGLIQEMGGELGLLVEKIVHDDIKAINHGAFMRMVDEIIATNLASCGCRLSDSPKARAYPLDDERVWMEYYLEESSKWGIQ